MAYGTELILDLKKCERLPCTRGQLEEFLERLCNLIGMTRADLHFWDYDGYPEEYKAAEPHLKGISAVQFIETSNITIHTLDTLKRVYLNIFSCKAIDTTAAAKYSADFFQGIILCQHTIERL